MSLWMVRTRQRLRSPTWMTFRQALDLSGRGAHRRTRQPHRLRQFPATHRDQ
ncbi:hypothetical protein FDV58_34055 [Bradyrhizobium elkanii]|uniref:Uncharacterized protein n=1 Tax=Bradyrhizobium elkanii TaxID=29448 RepID=A0A4U6RJ21_BRAEL|nr:hypothetical protein FDV58_34055 [Bradyrhizobium elkanii]